ARDQIDTDANGISTIGWSYVAGGALAALRTMRLGQPAFVKAAMYYPVCRGAPWSTNVARLYDCGCDRLHSIPCLVPACYETDAAGEVASDHVSQRSPRVRDGGSAPAKH